MTTAVLAMSQFFCPPDRELALRGQIKQGWSTVAARVKNIGSFEINTEEWKHIQEVLNRAEAMERMEEMRIGLQMLKHKQLQEHTLGDGTTSCILCAFDFAGQRSRKPVPMRFCQECGKAMCPRCKVEYKCHSGDVLMLCRLCYDERELWKKSGAWLNNTLPMISIPSEELERMKEQQEVESQLILGRYGGLPLDVGPPSQLVTEDEDDDFRSTISGSSLDFSRLSSREGSPELGFMTEIKPTAWEAEDIPQQRSYQLAPMKPGSLPRTESPLGSGFVRNPSKLGRRQAISKVEGEHFRKKLRQKHPIKCTSSLPTYSVGPPSGPEAQSIPRSDTTSTVGTDAIVVSYDRDSQQEDSSSPAPDEYHTVIAQQPVTQTIPGGADDSIIPVEGPSPQGGAGEYQRAPTPYESMGEESPSEKMMEMSLNRQEHLSAPAQVGVASSEFDEFRRVQAPTTSSSDEFSKVVVPTPQRPVVPTEDFAYVSSRSIARELSPAQKELLHTTAAKPFTDEFKMVGTDKISESSHEGLSKYAAKLTHQASIDSQTSIDSSDLQEPEGYKWKRRPAKRITKRNSSDSSSHGDFENVSLEGTTQRHRTRSGAISGRRREISQLVDSSPASSLDLQRPKSHAFPPVSSSKFLSLDRAMQMREAEPDTFGGFSRSSQQATRREAKTSSNFLLTEDGLYGSIEFSLEYSAQDSTLEVTILRCRGLKAMDSNGFSDPYVKLFMVPAPKKSQRFKTITIFKTLNPEFHESFKFQGITSQILDKKALGLVVMDHDSIGSDDLVGAVKVPLYEVDQTKAVTLRRLLGNGSDLPLVGVENREKGRVLLSFSYSHTKQELTVGVVKAMDIAGADSTGYSDPYVKCILSNHNMCVKHKTKTLPKTLNPEFNEELTFEINQQELLYCKLTISVWDRNVLAKNVYIGEVAFRSKDFWRKLIASSGIRQESWHNIEHNQAAAETKGASMRRFT